MHRRRYQVKADLSFLLTAEELMKEKFVPATWIFYGLLRKGRRRISLLNSLPEQGKSTLARQAAVCASKGKPFMGRETTRCAVLYWQTEDEPEDLQESLRRLGYDPKTDEPIYIFRGRAEQNTLKNFDAALTAHPEIGLVIIETLDDLLRVQDILSNTAAREAFEEFDKVFCKHAERIACLALHHLKKTENKGESGKDILGATVLRGRTDAKWYLYTCKEDDGPIKRRIFEATVRRGTPIEPTFLVFDPETESSTLGETYASTKSADAKRTAERVEADIIEFFTGHPGASFEGECVHSVEVKGNSDQKRKIFRRLLANGRIRKEGKGAKNSPAKYFVCELPVEIKNQLGEAA